MRERDPGRNVTGFPARPASGNVLFEAHDSMIRSELWLAAATCVVCTLSGFPDPAGAAGLPGDSLPALRTPAETAAFERHTSHTEMMAYLLQVQRHASDMRLGSYGTSWEGRDLPFAIFSRPAVGTPAEAHATGKPVIVLGANVHGFNHVLREALLIMMRELGAPGTELNALLDEVIVLVVPSKNPDGLEAGIRFNARGADLNRDYMTLDEPSMAAYVGEIMNRWEPHLVVDGHDGGDVQYGGAYPRHLLYQGPGLAGADPALAGLADDRLFPHLDRSLEAAGFEGFYWSRGDAERWYAGGSAPRMGRNYGGLANKISILFEVAAWPGFEGGVEVGLVTLRSVLTFARDEGRELVATVQGARQETVAMGAEPRGRIPVAERMEAEAERVSYRIAHPEREGELLLVEDAEIMKRPVGTSFRERPYAYVLPPEAEEVVALLRRQRILVERLDEATEAEVRSYTVAGIHWEEGGNLHRSALRIEVGREIDGVRELPRGSWVVRTGQTLGRVVTHLLEPETGDSVYHWGRVTHLLPLEAFAPSGGGGGGGEEPELPIVKLMSPVGLP
ncbi:MAG: hypothetical protein EA350_17050, partial [Gemmatimonadales bacterium]